MRPTKLAVAILFCGAILVNSGCVSDQKYKDLKFQNDSQRKRISQLESELQTATLELDRLKRELEAGGGRSGVEMEALRQKIAALEDDLARKRALIAQMQGQLLSGGPLPGELSSMLEDWAKGSELVSFDANRGIVKFKSDLLFEKGSDVVAPTAVEAVKGLCQILNTDQAKEFDIIIAGHTDDLRISRPETRERHPTNWHLSAHRAIAVADVMLTNGVTPERTSVRGFSEFRPVVPNQPNKQGNPINRRVEIYIVPKGM